MASGTLKIFEPLTLPNGAVIHNRLCKAAMEENLSVPGQLPGEALYTLYRNWGAGGVGLILTGNVMIAPNALTGPGGVVLQEGTDIAPFKAWAEAAREGGAQLWMQVNHPGRQVLAAMGEVGLSPSAIPLDLGKHSKLAAQTRALTEPEIADIIRRFATTASLAEQAGFTGMQIHAAHGYLLSQFLSPLVNQREDDWGGSLEKRARLLFEVVKAVRGRVSSGFCVSVKLNSADFQKGGFALDDAKWVVGQLSGMGIDLIELSGGSYESPAMQGSGDGSTTLKREAYFVDFARDIAKVTQIPIMVTGGIRRRAIAEEAMAKDSAGFGVSMLGVARAMALVPDLPNRWKQGEYEVILPEVKWKDKSMAGLAVQALAKRQMILISAGKAAKAGMSPLWALVGDQLRMRKLTKRYRRWREGAA